MSSVFSEGKVAVVTGAALGIGLAAATRFAGLGMAVMMIDLPSEDFDDAAGAVSAIAGPDRVMKSALSVTDADALKALAGDVVARFGAPAVVMNNAVTRTGGGVFAGRDDWRTALEVNFWGVLNGVDAFAPAMLEANRPAYIVNVGSKQGITNPPGNAAYNVTKSAVKTYTEALQHDLRGRDGCLVSAHLLVPGWTTTGKREHNPGAWLPDQVIDLMLERLDRGSFYIICPDNEVSAEMDRKRILWAAGDMTEDRPPLSRWHGGYGAQFEAYEP